MVASFFLTGCGSSDDNQEMTALELEIFEAQMQVEEARQFAEMEMLEIERYNQENNIDSGYLTIPDDKELTEDEIEYWEEEIARREFELAGWISFSEVVKHNTADDCWLAIGGQVLDVTEYINSHPGDQAIVQGCGQDATILFETRPTGSGTIHSDTAYALFDEYYVGELQL